MKYQPIIPTDLFNMFIEKLGYMPDGEDILVIRDIYTACFLAINNNVTFVSDDQEAISAFINTIIINNDFKSSNSYIHIETKINNAWLNWIEKNMEFDVAIMNPPYNDNLHLKILEKVIPIANNVVNISPVRWLEDPLARYKKKSDYNKFEVSVSKKLEDIEVLDNKISDELFDIEHSDLGIYVLGNGGFDYSKLSEMDSITQKIFNKCNGNKNFMDISTVEGYRGEHDGIFGVINSHRCKSIKFISDSHDLFITYRETFGNKLIFFKTEEERDNCFDFLTSKTMKYYSSKIRKNQRIPWQFVPVPDFKKKCDDSSLIKFFGFTEEEYNTIIAFEA